MLPLVVGRVVGAHGLQGALDVQLFHAGSATLRPQLPVVLRVGETCQAALVARVTTKPGSASVRVWLEGVSDRAAADALRGASVEVDREHVPLEEGEFFLVDLIGLEVVDTRGRNLGRVEGVTDNGAQDLLVIARDGVEWLMPVLSHFIAAIEADRLVVDVPVGMVAGDEDETA